MIITRITYFAVGVAFLGVAFTASAQQPAQDTTTLARLEQALDADTYRAVTQVIDGARFIAPSRARSISGSVGSSRADRK